MVVAKVGSKAIQTAADNPGAGILVAVVGLLVIANVFRSTSAQVEETFADVIEGAKGLPDRGWDAIKPEPFPYSGWGDFWDDLISPATDLWDGMPWGNGGRSPYGGPNVPATPVPRPLVRPTPADFVQGSGFGVMI